MDDILKALVEGRLDIEDAKRELELRFYGQGSHNIDTGREQRTGVPEVVHAEGKETEHLISIIGDFLDRTGRVLVSRLESSIWNEMEKELRANYTATIFEYERTARFLVARNTDLEIKKNRGKVGILTAGTSDIPVAMEAEITVREMGCEVKSFNDVGIAGLHRVMRPLKELHDWGADVVIVAAGREGALPTLVSGLIRVPVIGLPVSTGYGIHGKGETALFAMLQSCSPLAVVNIDAGFVAGAIAGKIAIGSDNSR
ncbi:MAG: nickel pincer cofactor biosynthesis protein LarB [Candidatus Thermoplasmatota archaeon]|nr:nickel pincer cofactor biosynthesis protein LarB [Candidatus Thermoplasmatota archaeon]